MEIAKLKDELMLFKKDQDKQSTVLNVSVNINESFNKTVQVTTSQDTEVD